MWDIQLLALKHALFSHLLVAEGRKTIMSYSDICYRPEGARSKLAYANIEQLPPKYLILSHVVKENL